MCRNLEFIIQISEPGIKSSEEFHIDPWSSSKDSVDPSALCNFNNLRKDKIMWNNKFKLFLNRQHRTVAYKRKEANETAL
jgi:hypothetical protein